MEAKKNWAYILLCSDQTLYTGWTNDLEHRVAEHNAGRGAKYTRSRLPVQLLYYESYDTKAEAMQKEWAIKHQSKAEKLKLIKEFQESTPDKLEGEDPMGALDKATYRQFQVAAAKEKALACLTRSALSSGMLEEKLSRNFDRDLVADTVQRMIELGLINDLDYGHRLARDYFNLRGYSLRRIKQELIKRKIGKEYVAEIMAQFDNDSEYLAVIRLIEKKYQNKLMDKKDLEKTIMALQRRGFSFDSIRKALEQIKEVELDEE